MDVADSQLKYRLQLDSAPSVKRPTKLGITRRIRRLQTTTAKLECDARTFAGTVLRLWCKSDFPALPRSSLPISKELATAPAVISFVAILRQMEFLEASYWLSSAYAMLNEDDYRKKLAMFFTPASLTRGLLDDLDKQGVNFGTETFLDPACGGAAFLAPIALRMRTALKEKKVAPKQMLSHIERHLCGTDLDKTLCELSKQFLCMALHEEIRTSGYVPSFDIHRANSLTDLRDKHGSIDVVICNPPYRKMNPTELEQLRDIYADVVEAQPNLYCLFIALCVRLLRIGGRAALVTPTSFLSGQYFRRLREFLIGNVEIEHIGMVSDRTGIFIDVEQETAMTVLRRRAEKHRTQARVSVSVVSGSGEYKSVGQCLVPNSGAVWPIPRSAEDVPLLQAANRSKFRLTDYGYIVRIGAYVWNRDKRPKFASLKEAKHAKAHTAIPLLWSHDIAPRGIVRVEQIASSNGGHRFVDLGDKEHSSIVKAPCLVMQRVTSNDQPRRLVAAAVSQGVFDTYGGFIGENHVVIIEQVAENALLTPTKLVQLLSTHAIDRSFRCISGATNVSAFELSQLALPDPHTLNMAIASGKSMDEAVNHSYELVSSGD